MDTNGAEQSKTVAVSTATNATFKSPKSVVAEQDELSLTSNSNTTGNQATISNMDPHNFQCVRKQPTLEDLCIAIESKKKLSNKPIIMGQVKQNSQSRVKEDFFNKNFSPNKQSGDTISGNLSNPFASDQKYETETTIDGSYDFENILSNTSTSTVVGNKPITIEILLGESGNSADDVMSAMHSNTALDDQCDKSDRIEFGEKSHLVRRVREDEDIYGCVICGAEFESLRTMYHHLKTHPREGNTAVCTFAGCGKILSSKSALKTHVLIHENIKYHQCKECGKKLSSKIDLDVHMRIHTGEKPYTCKVCNMKFRHKQGLKMHMKTHENIENPLQCIHCYKTFDSFEKLNKHKRAVHPKPKTATCKICFKKLCSEASLATHMLIHDDVKNYKCSFCIKSFRHKQSLKKHEQLHKNPETPNQCVICQIDHKTVEELIRHNKRFHPKEKKYKCQKSGKYLCSKNSLEIHQYCHGPSGSLHNSHNQKDHQNTNHFPVNQKALFSQQAKTQGEKARNTTITSDDNSKRNLTGNKKIFNNQS